MARHLAQQIPRKRRSRIPIIIVVCLLVVGALAFAFWRFVLPRLHFGAPADNGAQAEVTEVVEDRKSVV